MPNPWLPVPDEATTEGLAPVIRATLAAPKAEGLPILVLDRNRAALRKLADRHQVLGHGRTVRAGSGAALKREIGVVRGLLRV